MLDNVKTYIIARISDMIGSQLGILLSYSPNEEHNKEIIALFNYVKNSSEQLYNRVLNQKKAFVLINSRYKLYKLISEKYRRDNDIQ